MTLDPWYKTLTLDTNVLRHAVERRPLRRKVYLNLFKIPARFDPA